MVWFGMVWSGLVWFGMVWYGLVWFGMVWYGLVWAGGGLESTGLSDSFSKYSRHGLAVHSMASICNQRCVNGAYNKAPHTLGMFIRQGGKLSFQSHPSMMQIPMHKSYYTSPSHTWYDWYDQPSLFHSTGSSRLLPSLWRGKHSITKLVEHVASSFHKWIKEACRMAYQTLPSLNHNLFKDYYPSFLLHPLIHFDWPHKKKHTHTPSVLPILLLSNFPLNFTFCPLRLFLTSTPSLPFTSCFYFIFFLIYYFRFLYPHYLKYIFPF